MKRSIKATVALALGCAMLASCAAAEPSATEATSPAGDDSQGPDGAPAAGEPIRLGVVTDLSGVGVGYGKPAANLLKMAAAEVNDAGGWDVGGVRHQVELEVYDDGCDAQTGLSALERLLEQDQIRIVLGSVCSSVTSAIAPRIEDRALLVSLGSVATGFSRLGNPNIFRPHATNARLVDGVMDFIVGDLESKRLAFIGVTNPFTDEATPIVEERMAAAGGQVVHEAQFEFGTQDVSSLLTSAARSEPDAIFFLAFASQTAQAYRQMQEQGIDLPFVGMTSGSAEEFLSVESAEVLEGLYDGGALPLTSLIDAPGHTRAEDLQAAYDAQFSEPLTLPGGANPYDILYLVLQAMADAGSTDDVDAISRALSAAAPGGQVVVDYPVVDGSMWNEFNEAYVGGGIREFENGRFRFLRTTNWGPVEDGE